MRSTSGCVPVEPLLQGALDAARSAWVDTRLSQLPRSLTVAWPGGCVGTAAAQVRLKVRQWRMLAWLASGRVGPLAEACVKGQLEIEGELADVLAVAAALAGNPVKRGERGRAPRWWRHWRSCRRRGSARSTSAQPGLPGAASAYPFNRACMYT